MMAELPKVRNYLIKSPILTDRAFLMEGNTMLYLREHELLRISLMTIMFLTFFLAVDLYAHGTKTELELNQDVFETEFKQREMRQIDYIGNALLITPVERIKESTEEIVLLNKAHITHEEIKNVPVQQNVMFEKKADGPKISLTF